MAMHKYILTILVAVVIGVQGLCPPAIVKRIKDHRTKTSQGNVLPFLGGAITWLTAASYFQDNQDLVLCFKTAIDSNDTTYVAMDALYLRNRQKPVVTVYEMVEREPGVITEKASNNNPSEEEKLYIISLQNKVMTFYQCQENENESYQGFSGIAVVNIRTGTKAYKDVSSADLRSAVTTLDSLGLEPLDVLDIDC